MKIITWNCNGAFRRKFESLDQFNADIMVIQECESPTASHDFFYTSWASNYIWVGDSKHKGLGIFAKRSIKLERLLWSDNFEGQQLKHFLPVLVNCKFPLLTVWTHYNNSPTYCYIGQFWKYFQVNNSHFANIIVIGDFNSNAIWDKPNRQWNHSNVVDDLKELKIKSLYHEFYRQEHGNETKPTFYLHRNMSKPYHLDYCFASETHQNKLQDLSVGNFEDWKDLSDHVPMAITFKD